MNKVIKWACDISLIGTLSLIITQLNIGLLALIFNGIVWLVALVIAGCKSASDDMDALAELQKKNERIKTINEYPCNILNDLTVGELKKVEMYVNDLKSKRNKEIEL